MTGFLDRLAAYLHGEVPGVTGILQIRLLG